MRNLGTALIVFGAFGVAVAMFVPVHGFGEEDWTWWEYLNGLDIALFVACEPGRVRSRSPWNLVRLREQG